MCDVFMDVKHIKDGEKNLLLITLKVWYLLQWQDQIIIKGKYDVVKLFLIILDLTYMPISDPINDYFPLCYWSWL